MQTVLIVAAVVTVVLVLPVAIDGLVNRSGRVDPANASPAARELHRSLWVADLHGDALLWNRHLLRPHRRGHVDVPRLMRGNVALQVFTVVTKVPFGVNFRSNSGATDMVTPLAVIQRWPPACWVSVTARAHYQARKFHRFVRESGGRLLLVKTVRDLEDHDRRRESGEPVVAGILGIEGAQVLDGRLATLDELFDVGFRLLGLAHFHDTEVAGSAHGREKGGLTPLGRQVIARMEQLGMIVDLAHASAAAIEDVVQLATKPVLVSHTGVRGTCDNPRNLSDAQLKRVAATGGLIGVAFFRHATCGRRVDAIVRAIRHVVDTVGVEHVALGSDFDGAVQTPFDSAGLGFVTDALLGANFAEHEVAAIMGENVRRFLMRTLPAA